MVKCAPKRKNDMGSCYTDDEIDQMILEENIKMEKNKTRKEKINMIKKHFKKKYNCSSESCWPIENHKKVHRPNGSWGKDGWLYDSDITQCIVQYTNDDFSFLGCTVHDFYEFNLIKYKFSDLPSRQLALVVTLDGLKNPGYPHWVSLLITKNHDMTIFSYFDPMNYEKPMKMLNILMTNLRISRKLPIKLEWNDKVLQKYDGDCGIYALDFIISMIHEKMGFGEYLEKSSKYQKKDLEEIRDRLFN